MNLKQALYITLYRANVTGLTGHLPAQLSLKESEEAMRMVLAYAEELPAEKVKMAWVPLHALMNKRISKIERELREVNSYDLGEPVVTQEHLQEFAEELASTVIYVDDNGEPVPHYGDAESWLEELCEQAECCFGDPVAEDTRTGEECFAAFA